MFETFTPYSPQRATRKVIAQANAIFDEYARLGFTLTLRQLFYQFVARGMIENTFGNYKRLGRIICDARDGGLIDWDAIEDRTREVNTHSSWENPASIIKDAAGQYQEDLWDDQMYRPEVWIEKDALLGVIEGICTKYRVPYFAHRGNNSQTLQHAAGERFARYLDLGLIPLVLHLADHDPNGIDMTRDNIKRLALYTRHDVEVRRIALNMKQVRQFNPPPSFVKETDTRTSGYRERFGTDECWELDALAPNVITDLIRDELDGIIDPARWRKAMAHENRARKRLGGVASNWTKVEKFVRKEPAAGSHAQSKE